MSRAMLAVACCAALTACGPRSGEGEEVFFPTWNTSEGVPEALLGNARK